MEETLWEAIERLEPLAPHFVSVTYGAGGSTRERTHATVKRILAETHAEAGRASDLRRRDARRDRRGRRATIGTPACATSWRCAAIRRAASARATRRIPAAISNAADLVAGIKRIARFRGLGVGLSGEASGKRRRRRRHRHAEGQGRRRRHPRHHPVLLRQRRLLPLSRPRARARHRHPDRAGHHAGAEFQAG